jgi:hypothetical protein
LTAYKLTHEGYVIRDGIVKIPVGDTPYGPPTNPEYTAYQQWLADGGIPDPADPVPPSVRTVTRRQALRALVLAGVSDVDVQGVIDDIEDETQRALAQVDWSAATEFHSNDPTLIYVAGVLGLDLGALFDVAVAQ